MSRRLVGWWRGGVLVACLLLVTGCSARMLHRPTSPTIDRLITRMWVAEMRTHLRHGDWILARSYSGTGDIIARFTGGVDLSHSVMWDAQREVVIESIQPITREISLESLVHRNHYLYIVRPAYLNDRDREVSVARARTMLGSGYDFVGLLIGIRDSRKTYCSLLLFWASDMASRNIEEPIVVAPSDLLLLGETVYFSGVRTSADVIAMAEEFLRAERRPQHAAASAVTATSPRQ